MKSTILTTGSLFIRSCALCAGGAVRGPPCPDVTTRSYNELIKKRPFEKYGEYVLKMNTEGGKQVWAVWCEPCGRFFKPNSSNGTLKNFENHLSGSTHETSLAKAEKKVRDGAEKAAEQHAKRVAMVDKHEADGECSICG